jgi:hypothetical protein
MSTNIPLYDGLAAIVALDLEAYMSSALVVTPVRVDDEIVRQVMTERSIPKDCFDGMVELVECLIETSDPDPNRLNGKVSNLDLKQPDVGIRCFTETALLIIKRHAKINPHVVISLEALLAEI